jgi:hypothetical protein
MAQETPTMSDVEMFALTISNLFSISRLKLLDVEISSPLNGTEE